MEKCNEYNGCLIWFVTFMLLVWVCILNAGMSSRERDKRIERKVDSISVKLDSIQNQLNSIKTYEIKR